VIHHFFGYCLYYLGDMPGAQREFESHLVHAPQESDTVFGLGLVAYEEGRLADAEERFRQSIALIEALAETEPRRYQVRRFDIAKCQARLADVYFSRDEYREARDALLAAIEIQPRHAAPYYTLSAVYRRLGNHERAGEALAMHERAQRARAGATGGAGGTP